MVDLTGQYEKIKDKIDDAIREVIESTTFIRGPQVGKFQEALGSYLDIPYVVACGNGTDALQVALMALELKPGDEIITTPFTFISTVEVIRLLGMKPVFCDVNPDTFNIDADKLENLITPFTKAIIPVHLFGQCSDMESINKLALKYGLYVIEDSAQSLGTNYFYSNGITKKAGSLSTIGCTSFFPSKNLGAWGDGGAIFTSDAVLGEKLGSIVNHGMKEKYYYKYIGVNSRLDTIQAALLNVKLKKLDEYNSARKVAAEYYDRKLNNCDNVAIPLRVKWSDHIFHQYTLKIGNNLRDDLRKYLRNKGIPAMVYYPEPLHLQSAYLDMGYSKGDFPEAEELSRKVISLPMHTELDEEQLEYISAGIIDFINQ